MASAWERKCYYSGLGKKVVFLPNLLLCEEFTKDTGYLQSLEGVLLLADVSGGLGMAEHPQTRALGTLQAFARPAPRQGGHLATAQACCRAAQRAGGFSRAVSHGCDERSAGAGEGVSYRCNADVS